MSYQTCATAGDSTGKRIRRGDYVSFVRGDGTGTVCPPVLVEDIHRQGYDGSILHTKPAPDPEYPHHFSCRARYTVKTTTQTCAAEAAEKGRTK